MCNSNLLIVPSNLSLTALHTFFGVKGETGRLTVRSLQLRLLTYFKFIKFGGGSIFGVEIFSIRG